jgi:hypothetical protein
MSSSFIHADIFFFISTISLIIITAGFVLVFVYVLGILRNVRDITDRAKAEWSEIVIDIRKLRIALRDEGVKWKHVVDLVRNFFVRQPAKKIKKDVIK